MEAAVLDKAEFVFPRQRFARTNSIRIVSRGEGMVRTPERAYNDNSGLYVSGLGDTLLSGCRVQPGNTASERKGRRYSVENLVVSYKQPQPGYRNYLQDIDTDSHAYIRGLYSLEMWVSPPLPRGAAPLSMN